MEIIGWTLALLALLRPSGTPAEHPWTHQQILDAIRQVESGGQDDCPDGDDGRAIGPFQICEAYWSDAVAFDPTVGGAYEDCRDRRYAERIVRAYMRRYVPEAWNGCNAEAIARTHNGGPRGAARRSTLAYWEKVEAVLEERAANPAAFSGPFSAR